MRGRTDKLKMETYFQSTRSDIRVSAAEAVLDGLAPDGGLFVDPALPEREFDWQDCLELSELGMAERILDFLLPGFDDMGALVQRAYTGKFDNERLAPLVDCGEVHIMELFHGPTSAFKDVALSMLPQLVTAARAQLNIAEDVFILTATSGDTGKAALAGFHDVPGTGIIVFYPEGGVSPVQRAQMVTQEGANVRVCAVKGNFDDCQRGVKAAFAALGTAAQGKRLSSANSINIGRLAPQVIYYFSAYAQLIADGSIKRGEKVDFIVPTGNFGDILAGYYARLMGLPVGRLVCAANENCVLRDFIASGTYDARRPFVRTSSPSMDILISSNLERLLYFASGRDTAAVRRWMEELQADGKYTVDAATQAKILEVFSAGSADEAATRAAIAELYYACDYLMDPHTAVAYSVFKDYKKSDEYTGNRCVVLSTASPFKFPAAVLEAVGGDTSGDEFSQMEELSRMTGRAIPKNLAELREKAEVHRTVIEKDGILDYVKTALGEG